MVVTVRLNLVGPDWSKLLLISRSFRASAVCSSSEIHRRTSLSGGISGSTSPSTKVSSSGFFGVSGALGEGGALADVPQVSGALL